MKSKAMDVFRSFRIVGRNGKESNESNDVSLARRVQKIIWVEMICPYLPSKHSFLVVICADGGIFVVSLQSSLHLFFGKPAKKRPCLDGVTPWRPTT